MRHLPPLSGPVYIEADRQADSAEIGFTNHDVAGSLDGRLDLTLSPPERMNFVVNCRDSSAAVEEDRGIEAPAIAQTIDGADDVGVMLPGKIREGADAGTVDRLPAGVVLAEERLRQNGDVTRLWGREREFGIDNA